MPKHDNFLADAIAPHDKRISYFDGFRFGLGFFVSGLLLAFVLGALTFGIIAALQMR